VALVRLGGLSRRLGGLAMRANVGQRAARGGPFEPERFAFQFASNVEGADQAAPLIAFRYLNPHTNGLPFCGPSDQGVTYMWRYRPTQQEGYYVVMWWCRNGTFDPADAYVGGHPYPQTQNNQGTTHWWEVAGDQGGDFIDSAGNSVGTGSPTTVVYDTWYTQALRVIKNGNGTKTFRFYFRLPLMTAADYCERTTSAGSPETATNPMVIFGDSPWFADFQHERLSGRLGQVKVTAKALVDADILSEYSDMNSLVSAEAQANVWWFKKGFLNIDDLTCDAGTGRAFAWANANKASLASLL
jgi:hypothetical protein